MARLKSKQKRENEARRARGSYIIGAYIAKYGPDDDHDQTTLVDLLADLLHLCDEQRTAEQCPMNFDDALRIARNHFHAEQEGK